MVDSLYYSSRKISERCENSFLDYRINYQKLCYLMRQITKDLNWPNVLLMQYEIWMSSKDAIKQTLHINLNAHKYMYKNYLNNF